MARLILLILAMLAFLQGQAYSMVPNPSIKPTEVVITYKKVVATVTPDTPEPTATPVPTEIPPSVCIQECKDACKEAGLKWKDCKDDCDCR